MQVTETLSEGLRRSYTVRVPAADIEGQARRKLAEIGKNFRLPGFRPGKVPPNLIRARFGASVMAEVLNETVNAIPERVVAEHQLRPAGQPKLSLARQPNPEAAAEDLDATVELELLPEIMPPDIAALEVTKYRAEPAAEVIETALNNIATQNRALEDITEERAAEKGDILLCDFTGRIDGTAFPGGSAKDATVEVEGGGFIPGFTEQLVGIKPGETRTIDVTFPAEYGAAELAGKAAQFDIEAKGLKRAIPAALDDALATKLGLESFEQLKTLVTEQIQREYDQMARLRIKRELLDILAERADFPSPQNLLEAEFGAIWARVESDRKEGRADEEDAGKDEETLRAEYRAIADRRVKLGLLLSEIGRRANVQVTQAELTQALRAEASRYPGQEQQVVEFFTRQPGAIEQLRGPIFEDKVVDHILATAKVAEKLVPVEDLAMPGLPDSLGAAGKDPAAGESDPAAKPAKGKSAKARAAKEAPASETEDAGGTAEDAPATGAAEG